MRIYILPILLILLLGLALPSCAYDNDGVGRHISGGPHRKINELALALYQSGLWADPAWKPLMMRIDPKPTYELTGLAVTEPGMELITEAFRNGNWLWWVIEGAYTADEPELYNSFRHFYDPLQNEGVSYLTDHLKQLDYMYQAFILFTKTGKVIGTLAGTTVNPEVDARSWAISGEAKNGYGKNTYCWNSGVKAMQLAFACTDKNAGPGAEIASGTSSIDKPQRLKQQLFAVAWRSLGETMHLEADMTCIPHVRNDSHPGRAIGEFITLDSELSKFLTLDHMREVWDVVYDPINTNPNLGSLRNDPYELLCREDMVVRNAAGTVDKDAKGPMDAANTPLALFDAVARYTNKTFFSADTISGKFKREGIYTPSGTKDDPAPKVESDTTNISPSTLPDIDIHSLNGMKDYPSPRLETCTYDPQNHCFTRTINGKPIRMADRRWLSNQEWGAAGDNAIRIAAPCVEDQASILIPVAVYANARLVDWFVPRVEVQLTGYDPRTQTLAGNVIHHAYGAYTTPLLFSTDDAPQFSFFVDGKARHLDGLVEQISETGAIPSRLRVKDGVLTLDLSKFDLGNAKQLAITLDIGGMPVRSNDLSLTPFDPSRINMVTVDFTGKLTFKPEDTITPARSIRIPGDMVFEIQPGLGNPTLTWDGLSFSSVAGTRPLAVGENAGDRERREGKFTANMEITGTLSPDGGRLLEFAATYNYDARKVDDHTSEYYTGSIITDTKMYIAIAGKDLPLTAEPNYNDTRSKYVFRLSGPAVEQHITQLNYSNSVVVTNTVVVLPRAPRSRLEEIAAKEAAESGKVASHDPASSSYSRTYVSTEWDNKQAPDITIRLFYPGGGPATGSVHP